ncbi:unnamed protein product [Rhizophagus irregularis]|nr:unnamed protein product [Rhizophagus irregularis]
MKKEQTFVLIHVNGGLDNMGKHLNSGRFCISEMSLYCVLYVRIYDEWKSLFGASHFYTFLEDSDQVYIEQYQILIP